MYQMAPPELINSFNEKVGADTASSGGTGLTAEQIAYNAAQLASATTTQSVAAAQTKINVKKFLGDMTNIMFHEYYAQTPGPVTRAGINAAVGGLQAEQIFSLELPYNTMSQLRTYFYRYFMVE